MRPRPEDRGDRRLCNIMLRARAASMRPRPEDRGDANVIGITPKPLSLQ